MLVCTDSIEVFDSRLPMLGFRKRFRIRFNITFGFIYLFFIFLKHKGKSSYALIYYRRDKIPVCLFSLTHRACIVRVFQLQMIPFTYDFIYPSGADTGSFIFICGRACLLVATNE